MEENIPLINKSEVTLNMIDSTHLTTKPLSNVYIDPVFEKKGFNFEIESAGLDEEFAVHSAIEKITSKLLYHWTNVPIVFPDSIVEQGFGEQFTGSKDLFVLPTFDELEQISVDSSGHRKKLSKDQLESIKKTASFEVPSANFPDKHHTWKLSKWLQKGSTESKNSFLKDISRSLSLIIITARNRFIARRFSILSGVKACGNSLYDLVDIFIGLPRKYISKGDAYFKVREELEKYLVEELHPDASETDKYNNACKQMLEIIEKHKQTGDSAHEAFTVPCYYRTSDGLLIDLRLSDNSIIKQIKPILVKLLKNTPQQRQKLNYLRQNFIKELRAECHCNEEIVKRTNKYLTEQYFKDLYQSISESMELECISPGIGKMLCEHAQVVIIMHEEQNLLHLEMMNHIETYTEKLRERNKVKSLVGVWLDEHVASERKRFIEMNAFTAHLRSVEKFHERNLNQAAYFIEREVTFLKKKRSEILKEEYKIKKPNNSFEFNRQIWSPKNYVVQKHHNAYKCQTKIVYKNSTMYPFWRWTNFFLRTWVYLLNSLFIFCVVIPFCSKLSLRALFSISPFYPRKICNKDTGAIISDRSKSNKTLTFVSRIAAIWNHVSKSRKTFEDQPDRGLLGKSVTRIFNVIWNYFIKGFIGTVGLILIYPILCLTVSLVSLVIGLLTPVWYPVLSILQHLAFVFMFDWELRDKFCRSVLPIFAIVIRFFLIGVVGSILAFVTAVLICPLLSIIVTCFAIVRYLYRKSQDCLMFNCILKSLAKVPSNNTFIARRIAGPGLASEHLFQIRPEQALAALEISIETKILNAYLNFIRDKLNEPLETYKEKLSPIFNEYSFELTTFKGPYKDVMTKTNEYIASYEKICREKLDKLERSLNKRKLKDVRMSHKNLNIFLNEAVRIVQFNYENIINKYKKATVEDLFNEAHLESNDWQTFTGHIVEEIFGAGILTPLEDTHESFNLEVDHLNLSKYTEMIATSELRDDLDLVMINYKPDSNHVSVRIPEEKCSLFQASSIYYDLNTVSVATLDHRFEEFDIPNKLPKNNYLIVALVNNHEKETRGLISYELAQKMFKQEDLFFEKRLLF